MPRKLRLEFPGAIYHVINRGNYRGFVFRSLGARQAFEDCLFEACERSDWLLHAFGIMGTTFIWCEGAKAAFERCLFSRQGSHEATKVTKIKPERRLRVIRGFVRAMVPDISRLRAFA